MDDALISDLETIVGSERVRTGRSDLLAYNADCSPRGIIRARGRRLDVNRPAAVVQPAGERELCALVVWARRTATPLVAFGAGSGVCLGAVGDRSSVIVDLKRLDSIVEVDESAHYVRAGAGVIGEILERELRRRGFTLGHYPSSLYCSSLGGYLAARSAGQYSSRYGKIEDMVASMRVVTGCGDVVETAPNPVEPEPRGETAEFGPNPTQLFVGSEGTLGFVTEATLHVEPAPDHQFYRGFHIPDLAAGLEGVQRLMQDGLRPAVVRLYDPHDTFFKGGGSEGVSSEKAGVGERLRTAAVERLPERIVDVFREQFAEARNAVVAGLLDRAPLVNGLLERLSSESLLIVGFEGDSSVVEHQSEYAFDLLSRFGEDLGPEPGMKWLRHRFDTSYLQSPLFDTGAFVDTMEVATTWDNLEHLYRAVRRALERHVLVLAHFSHVYAEGSSIYFTFIGHADGVEASLELHEEVWRDALDAAADAGGSVTHHHGVGALKADWVERDHFGGGRQFEALKSTFDPDGIMNPGKVYSN